MLHTNKNKVNNSMLYTDLFLVYDMHYYHVTCIVAWGGIGAYLIPPRKLFTIDYNDVRGCTFPGVAY